MSDVRYNSGDDWITRSCNDGDRCGSCFESQNQSIGLNQDHIRMRVDDITSKLRKIIGPSFGRIPLYDEVLTLNVAKAIQFLEKSSEPLTAIYGHIADLFGRVDHCNALHLT